MISVRSGSDRGGEGGGSPTGVGQAQANAGLEAFLGMLAGLPGLAAAADPPLAERCAQELEKLSAGLREHAEAAKIAGAAKVAQEQMRQVRQANESVIAEQDTAFQQLAEMASAALRSVKGCSDRGGTKLGLVAKRFEIISQLDDVHDMRRRLREDVAKLRSLIEDLGQEREKSLQVFESQVADFRHRMEAARSASDSDALTGVGSRRAGEKALQALAADGTGGTCLVLFDIDGFGEINQKYGKALGDQMLKALASKLNPRFSKPNTLFRWGSDEFLAIFSGSESEARERGESAQRTFGGATYFVVKDGAKKELSATVSMGLVVHHSSESADSNYARVRAAMGKPKAMTAVQRQGFEAAGVTQ